MDEKIGDLAYGNGRKYNSRFFISKNMASRDYPRNRLGLRPLRKQASLEALFILWQTSQEVGLNFYGLFKNTGFGKIDHLLKVRLG